MDHFFYPSPGVKVYRHGKWESWNKLRAVSSSRTKSRHKLSSFQLDTNFSFKRDSSKKLSRTELNKTSEIVSRLPRNEPNQRLYSQKGSTLDLEELLLLEHDLFSESRQQVKIPIFTKETQRKENTGRIELKGKQIKAGPIKIFRPIHKCFRKIALQPKPANQRSLSVNKSNVKRKLDTPSPWGFENPPDTQNNFQKTLKTNYQDSFTST